MKVIEHIKEMISSGAGENADAWAAQFFPGPQRSVASRVVQAVVAVAGSEPARLTAQTRLSEDLTLNELQRVQLVLTLEEQFQIELSERDVQRIQTLGQLVECVSGKAHHAEPINLPAGK
jgi:acyl carrier protein